MTDLMTVFREKPWLASLVIDVTSRGAYICRHGRQLSGCAECVPIAEQLYRQWNAQQQQRQP